MSRWTFLAVMAALPLLWGRGGAEPHEAKGEAADLAVFPPRDIKWTDAPPGASGRGPAGALRWLAGAWHLGSTADGKGVDAGSSGVKMLVREHGQAQFLFGPYVASSGTFTPALPTGKPAAVDLKITD